MADKTPDIPDQAPKNGSPADARATTKAASGAPAGVMPAAAGTDAGAQGQPGAVSPEGSGEKTGFFATRNGRLVMVAGAIVALLVVIVIAAALLIAVMGIMGNTASTSPPPPAATGAAPSATASGSVGGASTSTSVPVAPIGNADVYTVRDPFKPLISQQAAPETETATSGETSSSTTTSSTSTTATAANTLTLVSIETDDGVRKGTFQIGSATYVAGAGQRLDSTPWLVVSVGSDSAVVLYGDEQVTLVVGEGITK